MNFLEIVRARVRSAPPVIVSPPKARIRGIGMAFNGVAHSWVMEGDPDFDLATGTLGGWTLAELEVVRAHSKRSTRAEAVQYANAHLTERIA